MRNHIRQAVTEHQLTLITNDLTELDELLQIYAAYMAAGGCTDRTISERLRSVRRLMRRAGVDQVDQLCQADALRYIASVTSKSSRATYGHHVRSFAAFLESQDIPAPFAKGLPVPRFPHGVPRPIDANELAAALACGRQHERTMLMLAAYAGLRVSEIGRVAGEDLDRTAGALFVLGKGGKQAIIPTHSLLLDQARLYPPRGFWFGTGRGLTRSAVWRTMHMALARVGSTAAPHQVRHFYGTSLLDSGANIRVVQELMRHAKLSTTQVYTQVRPTDLRAAIDRLPEIA